MFYDSLRSGGVIRGPLSLYPRTVSETPTTITGLAGQTADLFVVKNSAGVDLFTVQADGDVTVLGDVISVDEIGGANMDLTGHLTVGDYMSVVGAASLSSTLSVAGAAAFASSVSVGGPAVFSGETQFSSYVSLNPSGALYIGQRSSDCPAKDNQGSLYVKDSSGTAELFYRDDTGSVVQLTSGGTIDAADRALSNLASVAVNTSLVSDTDVTDDLGSAAIRWNNSYCATVRTGNTATDTLLIQAYDNDTGPGYVTFITLTAGNSPTCDLASTVTVGSAYIYRAGGTDVAVADGGTGLGAWAVGSVVAANAENVLSAVTSAVGLTVLQNNAGAVSWNATTGTGNSVMATAPTLSGATVTLAAAGTVLSLTDTSTAYTTATAVASVVRSGNLTGVDTEVLYDFRLAPAFTLTEPASGTFTYYGASIDMSGLSVTAGSGTSTVAALHLKADDDADTGTNYALYVESGSSYFAGRVLGQQGADVTAANDTTLGSGNYFDVTGATQINGIASAGWTAGSVVVLQFDSNPTVKHNTAASAGFASLQLSGAGDFSSSAGDTLTLAFDGTYWREVARTAI
ncbi:MAG: hypothetical protein M0R37_14620 [Bacteroidales bacterium]|nr:hypothetical protein [Bacteroidales bacterium]